MVFDDRYTVQLAGLGSVQGREIDDCFSLTPKAAWGSLEEHGAGWSITDRRNGARIGPVWQTDDVDGLMEAINRAGPPPRITDPETTTYGHPEAVAFRAWLDKVDAEAGIDRVLM